MSRNFIRFYDGKPKALTFSYDDGVTQDIRLMEIFNARGLKGTFNINSGSLGSIGSPLQHILSEDAVATEYRKGGHEVACHGLTHDFLEKLPTDRALHEILIDRCNLEKLTGRIVRGLAYPWGTYNADTIKAASAAGIVYARTVVSTGNFGIPTDWMQWHATCHHNDLRVMELADSFNGDTPDNLPYDRTPWLFYVWGHSYEFDAAGNWAHMETFCDKVAGKEDVWYATNIEIHDYIEAYRALSFSCDGELVHNPSGMDVWLEHNRKIFRIPAGKTISFS